MRVLLPLAAVAAILVGTACSAPEVEGRTPEDAKKFETPAEAEQAKTPEATNPEEGAKTPASPEKDEATGQIPLTAPPAAGGSNGGTPAAPTTN